MQALLVPSSSLTASAALQTSDITSPPQSTRTDEITSPPNQRRRVQSPGSLSQSFPSTSLSFPLNLPFLPPLSLSGHPSSPASQGRPLFSSPPATNLPTSEIDLSSPLTYGTPSSRATPGGRSHGTPIHPRSDIGGSRRLREVNLNATDPPVSITN